MNIESVSEEHVFIRFDLNDSRFSNSMEFVFQHRRAKEWAEENNIVITAGLVNEIPTGIYMNKKDAIAYKLKFDR